MHETGNITHAMEHTKHPALAKESCVLLVICLLDFLSTAWLIITDRAIEGNPLMSFYLSNGWETLVGVKILLVALPIFVAEWGRRYRPRFVRRALRFAIAAYLGIYAAALVSADVFTLSIR